MQSGSRSFGRGSSESGRMLSPNLFSSMSAFKPTNIVFISKKNCNSPFDVSAGLPDGREFQ